MPYLDKLLAPYLAAMSGTPTTEQSLSRDPIYGEMFGGLDDLARPGMSMGGGVPWGKFGGDIELFYGGNQFNPSSVDPTHKIGRAHV